MQGIVTEEEILEVKDGCRELIRGCKKKQMDLFYFVKKNKSSHTYALVELKADA